MDYPLSIEGFPPATLTEVFSLSLAKEILSLAAGSGEAPSRAAAFAQAAAAGGAARARAQRRSRRQPSAARTAGSSRHSARHSAGRPGPAMAPPNVQPVQFANLQPVAMGGEQGNIGLLMDVYMEMTVELGRTRKRIKDILGIGEGTIIELDKLAGEPVDILVNHKLIAKGEVVVIDENFGVRVTEIVSQMDRMNELT